MSARGLRFQRHGVYDIANNVGWVSVGTDHDTAAFAVEPSAAGGNMSGNRCTPR